MASSPSAELARLGARLRRAGLREPLAIAAYGGATGIHAARLAARAAPLENGPAILELLVAGRPVAGERVDLAGDLVALGLVERRGAELAARARVIPFRGLLLVCSPDALPDDSSLHLIGALPETCAGPWLDVGTGCGIAPMTRPRLGSGRLGADIDGAAIERARLGAGLSGLDPAPAFAVADLFEGIAGRFALISFNAPLPLPEGLLERFWEGASRCLAPGGEVVIHAAGDDVARALGGEVIALRYTPASAPAPFSVIRWRPDRPARRRIDAVELTAGVPHISRGMFDR